MLNKKKNKMYFNNGWKRNLKQLFKLKIMEKKKCPSNINFIILKKEKILIRKYSSESN